MQRVYSNLVTNHIDIERKRMRRSSRTIYSRRIIRKLGWIFISTSLFSLIHILLQTLITLDISSNRIGDKGAEYLANALRNNTVFLTRYSFSLSF